MCNVLHSEYCVKYRTVYGTHTVSFLANNLDKKNASSAQIMEKKAIKRF